MLISERFRKQTDLELDRMTDHLDSILRCRPPAMSVDALSHAFVQRSTALYPVYKCLNASLFNKQKSNCNSLLRGLCGCKKSPQKHGPRAWWPSVSDAFDGRCPELNEFLRRLTGDDRLNRPFDGDIIDSVNRSFDGALTTQQAATVQALFEKKRCRMDNERWGKSCLVTATDRCHQTSMVVAKVVRTSIAALERTLQRVPDVNVVYYARDPRAMALSRHVADLAFYAKYDARHSTVGEARLLCVQMWDDLVSVKHLERKYPGAFIRIRYEDFITDPLATAARLFAHIGRTVPRR